MNYILKPRSEVLSKAVSSLFLTAFVLFFSIGMNLQAHAQGEFECITLDDFVNTELPGNEIELDDLNPGPVNVLDNGSPGVLGNIREITFGPIPVSLLAEARVLIEPNVAGVGLLGVSNEIDTAAPLTLLYNAGGEGLNLDLTQMPEFNEAGFQFSLISNDLPGNVLEIVLQDSNSNNAQTLIELPVIGMNEDPILFNVLISEFSGIDSLDLTDIQSIDFSFTPPLEVDYLINAIEICSPPSINVPTLSEWGLIAMAGVLGLVGFIVARRKKLAVNQ